MKRIAIVYNANEIDLYKDQSRLINEALESMPKSVRPKYDSENYTHIKYHPTKEQICLPLEIGRFTEWDDYIESALKRPHEELTDDWTANKTTI